MCITLNYISQWELAKAYQLPADVPLGNIYQYKDL